MAGRHKPDTMLTFQTYLSMNKRETRHQPATKANWLALPSCHAVVKREREDMKLQAATVVPRVDKEVTKEEPPAVVACTSTCLSRHVSSHLRTNTGHRAEGVENRAEDSAHGVWQQYSHVDSSHTSRPESDDLALDVAVAPSHAGAVAKL
ncbi:MAG: hypothetical protein FRX49_07861 [Trebouxia sp. A1-2]|nr:MAG: hypothetical protein FRX49_07861 [Trebouxia sp. A1-2]